MRILAYILALITLGGLAPPRALSQPYRLVCSYFDEPRAAVYWVDQSGSVTLDQNLSVENDSYRVTASPDGRAFVVAQGTYLVSDLPAGEQPPWFFVKSDGSIERAADGPKPGVPSVYSPDGSLCFSGAEPCRALLVNYKDHQVAVTDYSAQQDLSVSANSLGFSPFASILVWAGGGGDFMQSVPVSLNGRMGNPSDLYYYADKGSNRDMDVSPDGRFVTVLGLEDPQLAVIGILPDGTFYSVQNLLLPYSTIGNPYRVRYTPDGRFLLVESTDYQHFLTCFAVDAQTGALGQTGYANSLGPLGGFVIDAMAITPDSRFVVIPDDQFATSSYNQTFIVYRINDDGTLTRITQTRHDFPGYVSDMDFIPPYREPVTVAGTGWVLYQ